eukprot:gene6706-4803_t
MLLRRKVLLCVVGLPVGGFAGLVGYIKYRELIRPSRHVFPAVLDDRGALVLQGKTIPKPKPLAVGLRFLHLVAIFLPMGVLYMLMAWTSLTYSLWVRLFLRAVERAGPVFVKMGQWSCTREDLFSKTFREQCKRLYNETSVHPYATTLQILEEELGTKPSEVFDSIEPKTVGSGSIGQVHVAKLKGSDRKVVVKVMHPNIVDTISRDFLVLQHCAALVDRYFPAMKRFELPRLALAFSNHLASQLDFRIEAENLEQFRHNFRDNRHLLFPEPLRATQRMLVETFCEGEPAHPEYLASLPSPARSALASTGLNAWCQMLMHDNFIHGDMHPGNILIDCSNIADPHVYLIDVGLCQQLTAEEADLTRDLLEAFVRWNPLQCAQTLWGMSAVQRFGNQEGFTKQLQFIFAHFRSTRNDPNAVTNVLESIFHAVRDYRVQMDPPFVSLLFSVLVLESFIMSLDPNFNLVRHTAPWLVSEGAISLGVVKNYVKSQWNDLHRQVELRKVAYEHKNVAAGTR